MSVILFGPTYSVYVRIVRIALQEKGVDYEQQTFDVFDPADIPADYPARQPFLRVPAFEHDGFRLYETGAITRYVDEAFEGPSLQPATPQGRARMNQVISILDAYAYWPLVRVIYVQRGAPVKMEPPDETAVTKALEDSARCLGALEALVGDEAFLAGPDFTLADAHAIPIFDYFLRAEEGQGLMSRVTSLSRWWSVVRERPSFGATAFTVRAS